MPRPPLRGTHPSMLISALLLVSVAPLSAQQLPVLRQGDRVRIHMHTAVGGMSHIGTLIRVTPDSIYFRAETSPLSLAIERTSVDSLQLNVQRVRGGIAALGGAGVGLLAGMGVTAALLIIHGCDDAGCGGDFVVVLPLFAVPGMLVGAGVGKAVAHDRWRTVPIPSQLATGHTGGRALTVGVSLPTP